MTGFRGQKFDFTGEDGAWYAVLDDGSALHINMRGESGLSCGFPSLLIITKKG